MINKEQFFAFLDEKFPNAYCELRYTKDYELLIAVMLSAQTPDKAVNKATAVLFNKYKTCEELAGANYFDVQKIISNLGMANVKARNVIKIAERLQSDYKGHVPNDPDALLSLPGVGNKTKNCVLAELYNEPYIAIDTHMQRTAKRLGIASEKDSVETIEKKYLKFLPRERIIKLNHQIIWFGRYLCTAISPKCAECKLHEYCSYYKHQK